jgi:hypothetical protein
MRDGANPPGRHRAGGGDVGRHAGGRSPGDLDRHTQAIQECADAGVDESYVQQIRTGHDRFFDAYAREILPRFA